MNRVLLSLHFALLLSSVALLVVGSTLLERTTNSMAHAWLVAYVVSCFGGLSFVIGLALMALRRGKSENLILAASTVTSFLLLVIAC